MRLGLYRPPAPYLSSDPHISDIDNIGVSHPAGVQFCRIKIFNLVIKEGCIQKWDFFPGTFWIKLQMGIRRDMKNVMSEVRNDFQVAVWDSNLTSYIFMDEHYRDITILSVLGVCLNL